MSRRSVVVAIVAVLATVASAWAAVLGAGPARASTRIVEQTSSGTVFEVTLPGVEVARTEVDGQLFSRMSFAGGYTAALEVGRPDVSAVPVLLAVPTGAEVTVQVESVQTETFEVGTPYPLQPALMDGEAATSFVADKDFYRRDGLYPADDVRVVSTGKWRDLQVVNVQVYPVRYNAATGAAVVATNIRIRVGYSGGTYPDGVADWMMPMYAALIDNFEQLPVGPVLDSDPGVRYLVFSHSNHADNPWLQDSLLGWVGQRGYQSRVITSGSFTADAIRDSIAAEYGRHTPPVLRWVLLVGEYDEVPMTSAPQGDARYAFVDEDNWPEVGVARLSPETGSPSCLEHQVSKILAYQRNPRAPDSLPPYDWLDSLHFVAHMDTGYMENVRAVFGMQTYSYFEPCRDTVWGAYQSGNNERVAAILNSGTGVMLYRGHGTTEAWSNWDAGFPVRSWTIADIDSLENGTMTPVVANFACQCGSIPEPTCLAEKWMRKFPGGAVAALGTAGVADHSINNALCSAFVHTLTRRWEISGGEHVYEAPVFDLGGATRLLVGLRLQVPFWRDRLQHDGEVRLPRRPGNASLERRRTLGTRSLLRAGGALGACPHVRSSGSCRRHAC